MKRHPQKSKSAPTAPRPLSRRRLWFFRIAALLLPILLLGLVEVALRLGGYGYATSFLSKTTVNGQECFVNNDTFTLRFFPPELARWPGTLKIPVRKAPDTTRIFIFGESAAMGDPQPAYGPSRCLEMLLRERFPGRKFEIFNTGITAINSHVILPIARECAGCDGDLWIIYMGNNEMVGPFGAATIFGSQSPPRALVRFYLTSQKMRVGQLALATVNRFRGKSANASWGGMQMFLQNQIPPNDTRRAAAYRNFEANLHDILRAGLNSGAKVILSTMSVNLRDCPPFASLGNSNRPAADRAKFGELYAAGLAHRKAGDDLAAANAFEQAAAFDPDFAELQYRWAESLLRSSNAAARAHYQLACDTDALPFRADRHSNGIIRRVGDEFADRGLMLSDAETELANASPFGIAGSEVFFEHVHFSFRGNYLLGRLWAEQVARGLPAAITATNTQAWASQETCERDLGLTLWNRGFVLEVAMSRMQRPPLNQQFNNAARLADLQGQLNEVRQQQAKTNSAVRCIQELQAAMNRAPRDGFLFEAMANLLEALGDKRQAARAYERLHELSPHDFYCNLQLGRLRRELGQPAEGETLLRQAARQRPSVADVWSELGDVCLAQKKFSDALAAYERAARLQPRQAAHVTHIASALAELNRRADAIASYRRAIQMQPEIWEAHFGLAGQLAADNQIAEAQREYIEALRLNPRHAVSRINLGVVLFRLDRLDEAIKQFEAALQLEPTNAAAMDYLRQVIERRDRKR